MGLTPMMKQYKSIKEQYPDSILFFRLGDFYEMFFEDALIASKVLDITLTSRDSHQKVPMCGVPYHSVDSYIAKMISNGYKVALCDQVEDAKAAKGIVKRQVTRVITPGTVMEGQLLEEKKNNYIASILLGKQELGLAFADVSTGEFMVTELKDSSINATLIDELGRLQPSEILLPESMQQDDRLIKSIKLSCSAALNFCNENYYHEDEAVDYLNRQFSPQVTDQLDLPGNSLCLRAAGALVRFLLETQKRNLSHIRKINKYSTAQYMALDGPARRNLELTRTLIEGDKKGSLLWVLDHTVTAMGGRKLKKWIEQPLLDVDQINARLDAVEELTKSIFLREDLRQSLKQVYDLERLTAKVSYGTANARDLLALKNSLAVLPEIKKLLSDSGSSLLLETAGKIDVLADLSDLLERALADDPPVSLRDGGLIKSGYDDEVDKLRDASANGRNWLARLEVKERERTGIKSLKIRFNKVFGYYIEVTKSNLDAVPEDYQRRQTLANAERFITPELKKYEEMILGAQDKLVELEYRLFVQLRESVAAEIPRIQQSADAVASIDVLVSLAEAAVKYNYVRPVVNHSGRIDISEGRHPVVERALEEGEFVPNNTHLDNEGKYIALITGPNMGGKSTYQRQVALITIMAQMGSFVPAGGAEIGIVDRIFARVGASDDLASGRSTFMVEMNECNNALRLATKKSLVIIDELGRGTSNLEGMAIAQAVIEYLHHQVGCRTLFSTHYHELAEMEGSLSGLKNYAAAVEEKGDNVIFLHRIVPGKASKSYGVHCARLAGLPGTVIDRANGLVEDLERYCRAAEEVITGEKQAAAAKEEDTQLELFTCSREIAAMIDELLNLELLDTTPLEALTVLFELQKKARKLKSII
ncbi:DNA mismatch repair protein MutS [Desulfohalotomaculum tongense]|nr:DNA mismatch repair protein MutS [Desulforadius tongensis]